MFRRVASIVRLAAEVGRAACGSDQEYMTPAECVASSIYLRLVLNSRTKASVLPPKVLSRSLIELVTPQSQAALFTQDRRIVSGRGFAHVAFSVTYQAVLVFEKSINRETLRVVPFGVFLSLSLIVVFFISKRYLCDSNNVP
jgi:hypothetical protein